MYQKINVLREQLVSLWFPALCVICRAPLTAGEHHCCLRCRISLPFFDPRGLLHDPVFRYHLALPAVKVLLVFRKHGLTQEILHHMKYEYRRELARYMGQQLALRIDAPRTDGLIPVPQHWRRHWQRGYNQAEDLANGMAQQWKVPVLQNVLVSRINKKTQTRRGRDDRWAAVNQRFRLAKGKDIAGKSFVVVDDIITTGATTEACASILLKGGAREVAICALALAE